MAKSAGILWIRPPAEMQRNMELYGQKVNAAIQAVAEYIAQRAQNDSRRFARWHDRTGNARSGLIGRVDVRDRNASGQFLPLAERIVTVYLIHTMSYGVYLELCNAGKYAIIMPTLEKLYPEVQRMLRRMLG